MLESMKCILRVWRASRKKNLNGLVFITGRWASHNTPRASSCNGGQRAEMCNIVCNVARPRQYIRPPPLCVCTSDAAAMRVRRRIHARTIGGCVCVCTYVYVYSERAHNAGWLRAQQKKRERARGWPITVRYYGGVDAILPATAKLKVIENRIEISSSRK